METEKGKYWLKKQRTCERVSKDVKDVKNVKKLDEDYFPHFSRALKSNFDVKAFVSKKINNVAWEKFRDFFVDWDLKK